MTTSENDAPRCPEKLGPIDVFWSVGLQPDLGDSGHQMSCVWFA